METEAVVEATNKCVNVGDVMLIFLMISVELTVELKSLE